MYCISQCRNKSSLENSRALAEAERKLLDVIAGRIGGSRAFCAEWNGKREDTEVDLENAVASMI